MQNYACRSGTPSMMDIEAFSLRYREKLDEAEVDGSIPNNISLEVGNPCLHCQFDVILCQSRRIRHHKRPSF